MVATEGSLIGFILYHGVHHKTQLPNSYQVTTDGIPTIPCGVLWDIEISEEIRLAVGWFDC